MNNEIEHGPSKRRLTAYKKKCIELFGTDSEQSEKEPTEEVNEPTISEQNALLEDTLDIVFENDMNEFEKELESYEREEFKSPQKPKQTLLSKLKIQGHLKEKSQSADHALTQNHITKPKQKLTQAIAKQAEKLKNEKKEVKTNSNEKDEASLKEEKTADRQTNNRSPTQTHRLVSEASPFKASHNTFETKVVENIRISFTRTQPSITYAPKVIRTEAITPPHTVIPHTYAHAPTEILTQPSHTFVPHTQLHPYSHAHYQETLPPHEFYNEPFVSHPYQHPEILPHAYYQQPFAPQPYYQELPVSVTHNQNTHALFQTNTSTHQESFAPLTYQNEYNHQPRYQYQRMLTQTTRKRPIIERERQEKTRIISLKNKNVPEGVHLAIAVDKDKFYSKNALKKIARKLTSEF